MKAIFLDMIKLAIKGFLLIILSKKKKVRSEEKLITGGLI